MFQVKPLAIFCFRFILIYGLLIVPWPGWQDAYAKLFRAGGAFALGELGAKGVVFFEPHQATDDTPFDTDLRIGNRAIKRVDGTLITKKFSVVSYYFFYIYTAFTMALILATPMSWLRRAWALFWGILLTYLFITFKLLVVILYVYNWNDWLSLFVCRPSCQRLLIFAYHDLVINLTFNLIASLFIWIIVSFRRQDWVMIMPPELTERNGHG